MKTMMIIALVAGMVMGGGYREVVVEKRVRGFEYDVVVDNGGGKQHVYWGKGGRWMLAIAVESGDTIWDTYVLRDVKSGVRDTVIAFGMREGERWMKGDSGIVRKDLWERGVR